MAENEKTFYLKSGKSFSSLKALAKELRDMSEDIYSHHVNPAKNDFENWIKNSLGNQELSKKIQGHINKIELELEVLRHLLIDEAKKVQTKKKEIAKPKVKVIEKKEVKKAEIKKSPVKKTQEKPKSSPKKKKETAKKK